MRNTELSWFSPFVSVCCSSEAVFISPVPVPLSSPSTPAPLYIQSLILTVNISCLFLLIPLVSFPHFYSDLLLLYCMLLILSLCVHCGGFIGQV